MLALAMDEVLGTMAAIAERPSYALELLQQAPYAYFNYVKSVYETSPMHVLAETSLVIVIVYILLFKKSYDPTKRGYGERPPEELTEAEIDEMVEEWRPEPLLPAVAPKDRAYDGEEVVVRRVEGLEMHVQGREQPLLNFATFDFLGMSTNPRVKQVCKEVLDTYTLGSCGPRGFYGTFDKHLELEGHLARFLGAEDAISYSDAVSAVSSAIPAFCKRGDLLVVDEGVNDAVLAGVNLSRARIIFFKHNDMADLERILREVVATDRRRGLDGTHQRRYIVVEGIYRNYGDVCPIAAVVQLKRQFKFRIVLDECISFGVLGSGGRGVTEHAGVSFRDADIFLGAMNSSLASVGGFCAGMREVVDHQRLSGAGYCFSAAAPPFTAAAADEALKIMESEPQLLAKLHENARLAHARLAKMRGLVLGHCDATSPVLHLRLADNLASSDYITNQHLLQRIADAAADHGVAVAVSKYIRNHPRPRLPPASLRVAISALHTREHIDQLGRALEAAVSAVTRSA